MVRTRREPRDHGWLLLSVLALGAGAVPLQAQSKGSKTPEGGEFTRVALTVSPSVVTLLVEADADRTEGFFGRSYGGVVRGGGSGVVIGADGVILTNNHVIENAKRIEVELHGGRRVSGRVLGADSALDLAVVKADATGLSPARFGDSDRLRAGDWVVAIGAPFGLRHTVTAGVISSVDRNYIHEGVAAAYLQTDATINPGNSGGPLCNLSGEVVGINTAYIGESTGIAFSIPGNLARETADQLVKQGRVSRGYLGIGAQDLDQDLARYFALSEVRGALVSDVAGGGPAAQAGVRPGDIAYGYDGQPLADAFDLLSRAARSRAGQVVLLDVLRGGKPTRLRLRAAAQPALAGHSDLPVPAVANDPMFGLKVRALTQALRQELGYEGPGQVVVSHVIPSSPADRMGLHAGHVLLEADLRPLTKPRDMLPALADRRMLLRVQEPRGEPSYVLLERE